MQTFTLKELAELTGVVAPRLVSMWKRGAPVTGTSGSLVKNDINDDGESVWWLDPKPANANHAYCRKVREYDAVTYTSRGPMTLEEAKAKFLERGVIAVDVADFSEEDKAEFLAWRKDHAETEGLAEDAEAIEVDENQIDLEQIIEAASAPEITKEWLISIDGIGKKGAGEILAKLAEEGITTFEAFAQIPDLTKLPSIGKKNGENLRAALLNEIGSATAEPGDSKGDARAELFGAIAKKLDAMEQNFSFERAIEIVEDRLNAGEYDAAIERDDVSLDNVAHSAALYCRMLAQKEALEAQPKGIQILCPHCNGLFDQAPAGQYDASAEALCEDDEGRGLGNCGKTFWLEVTADGYVTHKSEPVEPPKSVEPEFALDGGQQAWPEPTDADAWPAAVEKKAVIVPMEGRVHPSLPGCTVFRKTVTHSDDWHKARSAGIGSSDAGAIIGVSPYSTAVDVWKTKLGQKPKRKPWLDDYADFGTWFEPYIREFCEAEHGIEIIDGADLGTLQSVEWGRALANIDGLDVTNGVVEEYKTTTDKWSSIPAHYEAQVQHQIFVTGVNEIRLRQFVSPIDRKLIPSLRETMRELGPDADRRLADWLLEHGQIHTWIIERETSYIERMIAREKAFWTFVEMEIEPVEADPEGTVDLTSDPDVYAACVEYARLVEKYDAQALAFLAAEGIGKPKRGSVSGAADKAIKAAKTKARKAIDKAVSLLEERPKRLTIGDHSATFVDRGTHAYWNIYTGEDSGALDF